MKRARAFLLTGAITTPLSTIVFAFAISAGAPPHLATVLRLLVTLPILYIGYSRFMLAEAFVADRAALGRARAELRMIARVASAVGASNVLKLVIEPLLTAWLAAHYGTAVASMAPLAGDLGYGPLATYTMLIVSARWRRQSAVDAAPIAVQHSAP
jgi:hypothetical protein